MNLKECVYSVLIVNASEKFGAAVSELLPPSDYFPVQKAGSISEAKRLAAEKEYDFIIINSPLADSSGISFAIDCCSSKNSAVLLIARSDIYDEVRARVVEHGVFTLSKPTGRAVMRNALDWMASARERLRNNERKSRSLEERMAEIRLINRAKLLLVSERGLSEPEAHHYIEKAAMNGCITKKQAAEQIVAMFE